MLLYYQFLRTEKTGSRYSSKMEWACDGECTSSHSTRAVSNVSGVPNRQEWQSTDHPVTMNRRISNQTRNLITTSDVQQPYNFRAGLTTTQGHDMATDTVVQKGTLVLIGLWSSSQLIGNE